MKQKRKELKYSDVANLPNDHPLYKEFIRQVNGLDQAYADAGGEVDTLDDEESLDYFNRYIAGDR